MQLRTLMAKTAFNTMQIIRKYNREDDIETWDKLNYERKKQVRGTVNAVIENPYITAKEIHIKWENIKLKDGWKYAPATDRSKKLHACLVPFEKLNDYQKMKDDIFIEIVKNIYNEFEKK